MIIIEYRRVSVFEIHSREIIQNRKQNIATILVQNKLTTTEISLFKTLQLYLKGNEVNRGYR